MYGAAIGLIRHQHPDFWSLLYSHVVTAVVSHISEVLQRPCKPGPTLSIHLLGINQHQCLIHLSWTGGGKQ